MWFAENLSDGYSVNIAQYYDLHHEPGALDLDLLIECCEEVGKFVESPYARLVEIDGIPMQYVDVDYDQHVDVYDFRDRPDPLAEANAWMLAEYRRTMDLSNDQLIVIALLRVSDEHTLWYNRAHHIILDGYAAMAVALHTMDLYNARRRGEDFTLKPACTLAELVDYETTYQNSTRRETDRAHWLSRVQNLPERVSLSRATTSAPLSFDNLVANGELPRPLQSRIEELSSELNSSMAVLLTAAFGSFLARMRDIDDVVLTLPVAARTTAKVKRSGGMMSNAVPIRLDNAISGSVREMIAAAQLELTGALRYQRYRTEDIQRDAGLDGGSISFGPIINMVFFDNQLHLDGVDLTYRILSSGILEDLLLNLYQSSPDEPVVIDLHGNPHLYTQQEMSLHHRRFIAFLERFVEQLDVSIADLELLLPGESDSLVSFESGPGMATADGDDNLLDAFAEAVTRTPDAIAVEDDRRSLTYRRFDELRRDLAATISDAGVRPGDRVTVVLPRSIEQVVAVHAVVTAGAAYVPVDPSQPVSRRELIEEVSSAKLTIDEHFLASVGFGLDDDRLTKSFEPVRRSTLAPAYVLFTSGSTGTPKGVVVPHQAIIDRLAWAQDHYPLNPGDGFLYKTPITFDVSVPELFWPLQVGARIVVARDGGHRDPGYLRECLLAHNVAQVHFVPSMLDVFIDSAAVGEAVLPDSVRRVLTSGEALPAPLAARLLDRADVELINLYGPTEAAVDVTEYAVQRGDVRIPIGRPVPATTVRVLDRHLRRTPVGVVGELYLVGAQLAIGYAAANALTASRFVADSEGSGGRMYRTGDLVRWEQDGTLSYLGRKDFQVKIRGQRVELGEIEATIDGVDGVDAAAVLVVTERSVPRIVAYVKCQDRSLIDDVVVERVLRASADALPSHMVPSAVVRLAEFPTNVSGKLDRGALPAPPAIADRSDEYVAPVTPIEVQLANLVAEVLELPRVSMTDNLFALGADSLAVARLASRVRKQARLSIQLSDLFDAPTIGALAGMLVPLAADDTQPDLAPRPRPERIPLSYPQTRMWILNRIDPASGAYNMPGAVRLTGDVDVDAMRRAAADVVGRHETLRTVFPMIDGEPTQDVRPVDEALATGVFEVVNTTHDEVSGTLVRIASRGFDLERELPARFRLLRVDDDSNDVVDTVFVAVLHHIAGDGASLGPLIRDVMGAYAARRAGVEPIWATLPVQYVDFTLWQRELLGDADDESSRLSRQLEFWRHELDGLTELTALPIDRPRPPHQSGDGARLDIMIDAATVAGLRAVAAAANVTLFTVFQTLTATVVGRLSDSDDVAIGTAVVGRDDPALQGLVGMFVNTVVLRHRLRPSSTFAEALHDANRIRSRALSNADVPFEQVVDTLEIPRATDHSPLFQVELAMQHDQVTQELADDASMSLLDVRTRSVKYDLALAVTEFGDGGAHPGQVSVEFAYATDLFDAATIERIADYFTRIIRDVAEGGVRTPMSQLLGSTDAELAAVRAQSLGEHVDIESTTLATEVARQIAETPSAIAFVSGDRTMTYGEFGLRVSALARVLIERGAGPEVAVGVAIPRSIEMYIAIHGIIAAGAQYVPLAIDAPVDRMQYMLTTAGAVLTIVNEGAAPASLTDEDIDVELIEVPAGAKPQAVEAPVGDHDRLSTLRPRDAAYTLFTSGSTGRPKGVTVEHAAIINRLEWAQSAHRFTRDDAVLHKTPITFDVSVWELFWPLMTGARVVIADDGRHGDPQYLAHLIADQGVTVAHFVPSMLAAFADVLGDDRLSALDSLRLLVTSGEALTPATADRVLDALPDVELANLYGPTEAAVDVTSHRVRAGDPVVPIGRPIWNTQTRVLDTALREVPTGVPGELYLGGTQVARGYALRSALTAERFVADPFGEGTRLYRTGDLARWNNNGDLEYLGRNDFQVKLRGQRLELGEIEAVIASVPGVVHATATVASINGGDQLVGYYAPDTVDQALLTTAVGAKLPDYMRPTVWMPLASMPLGSAGKVDRKSLPAPVLVEREHVEARTDDEAAIAEVFAEVLEVESVTVVESFFDLGGNSLSATKVAARASERLGREIPVAAVFEAPTVEDLANYAAELPQQWRRPELVARPHGNSGPLSAVQRGMWLVNRADPDSSVANVAMALELEGRLDHAAMRAAVRDLLTRHESLRTRYPFVDGDARQEVLSVVEAVDALEYLETDADEPVEEAIGVFAGRGFDVQAAPPMRVAVLKTDTDRHVLVVVVHHVSIDGASLLPMARDIMMAYEARLAGGSPAWSPLGVQYLDFTQWQHEWLDSEFDGKTQRERQLDYWSDRLATAPAQIELPTDRARPRTPSFRGGEVRFEIAPELARRIETVAREHRATPFMVYQAALAILLSRLTTQREIVIGSPVAGRGAAMLDDVIGMFVNTLALRTEVRGEEKFSEMLMRVRSEDLADMANADVPFDTVAARVVKTPATSYNPVYQVLFAYQNFYFPTLRLPEVTVTPVSEQVFPAKTDLQLTLFPNDPTTAGDDAMTGQFLFATDLFDESTIETIARRFVHVVTQIAENAHERVADISIRMESDAAPVSEEPAQVESLADLVQQAAGTDPMASAVTLDGAAVTFGALSAMTLAMAAALPDPDSALTTALMSLLPTVATSGPDVLGNVLRELRHNAHAVADPVAVGSVEGNDQT